MRTKLMLLLFAAMLGFSSFANAAPLQNYGYYYCGDCGISQNPPNLGDIYIFIKSTHITNQYSPGDTLWVCDGSNCIQIAYQANGNFYPTGQKIPDTHTNAYKNTVGAIRNPNATNNWITTVYWIGPGTNSILTGTVDIILVPDPATPSSQVGTGNYGFSTVSGGTFVGTTGTGGGLGGGGGGGGGGGCESTDPNCHPETD